MLEASGVRAAVASFHVPAAGVALLIGVDHLLDMAAAPPTWLGNYVAACVIDRFEDTDGRVSEPAGTC